MKIKLADAAVFARIISAALLICGYLLAGLYAARWLQSRGFPAWTTPLALLGGTVAALLAGWRELKSIVEAIRRDKSQKPK